MSVYLKLIEEIEKRIDICNQVGCSEGADELEELLHWVKANC